MFQMLVKCEMVGKDEKEGAEKPERGGKCSVKYKEKDIEFLSQHLNCTSHKRM